MAELNTDVRFVRGVGEARAKSLAKLGITDLKSLISYFPRAYEDRRESRRIAELQVGERACVTAMVASEPKLSRIRKGLELVKLRVVDESAALELTYFNQSYLKNTFHVGESYTFYGTVEGTLLRRTRTKPAVEREGLLDVTGCIVPVYPLTAGVGQSLRHRAIRQGLDEGADRLPDLLPAELRRQHGLCDVRYAYENIHFPADDAALAERMGVKVRLTEGDVENIKLIAEQAEAVAEAQVDNELAEMKAERSRVKKSIANYAAAIANGATSGTIIELINAAEATAAALDEAIAERELVAAPPKVSKEAIEYFLRNIAAAPDDKMKEKVISTMVNSVVVERVPDEGAKKDSDEKSSITVRFNFTDTPLLCELQSFDVREKSKMVTSAGLEPATF